MIRTFGWVMLCLCAVFGLGLYLGWFSLTASNTDGKSDLHVSLNKDKVHEDEETLKKKGQQLLGKKTLEGPIHQIMMATQELSLLDNQKQEVTIKVDATTRIKIGDRDASFSDLTAGDPATVTYEAKKDGNVARTITVTKKS
jgi:hypothetical protein